MADLDAASTPAAARAAFRAGQVRPTCGVAQGYAQANLMILPKEQAFDFLLFAQRNPKPCPLLEVMEPGVTEPATAPEADIRTDVPMYRVWRRGELVAEVPDIRDYWRSDLVTFVIGCSFTFDGGRNPSATHHGRTQRAHVRHVDRMPAGRRLSLHDGGVDARHSRTSGGRRMPDLRILSVGARGSRMRG